MVPPGLAFISFSQRAWDAHSKATMPRFYFDVSTSMRYFETGQPPWTPALPVMFALDLALDAIIEEGLEAIFARHRKIAGMMREGVKRLGLSLLPEDRVASDSVTAVRVPAGVDGVRLVAEMRKKHGVVTAGGPAGSPREDNPYRTHGADRRRGYPECDRCARGGPSKARLRDRGRGGS